MRNYLIPIIGSIIILGISIIYWQFYRLSDLEQQINTKNNDIKQLQTTLQLSNDIQIINRNKIIELQSINESINHNYKLAKEQLKNAKVSINVNNHITDEWVRYVSAPLSNSVRSLSGDTDRIDAKTTTYEPDFVAQQIIDNEMICEKAINQLENLQDLLIQYKKKWPKG